MCIKVKHFLLVFLGKLRPVYTYYFHLTPGWKILINNTERISLKLNKCVERQAASIEADLPSYWPDNNKEDGKQGRRNGSKSLFKAVVDHYTEFISETKWFSWKMSVFLKRMRPGPNVSFSPGKRLHSTRCKTKQTQFLKFTGTLLSLSCTHRGAPTFRLNVQMSSVTQNRSKNNWTKTTQQTKKNVLQSLKHPRLPTAERSP